MSLLDVINNRISELTAATDAKYKAAGYEVPTASQRKAAEFNGVNPYEYATQLKQAETAQKEAEKAAKKAAKAAQKSSSSRSSSGSSGSYRSSSSSGSAEYESQGESSDMWASMLGEDESETIPSIKSMEQLQDEYFKIKQARRRKKGAEKVLRDYNEARMAAAAENFKENRPKKKGDKKHSTYGDEEERTTETPSVLAAQQGNLGDDFKREREEQEAQEEAARQEQERLEQIPSLPINMFPQGSMEKSLYDIRNAEMAELKALKNSKNPQQSNLIGTVTGNELVADEPLMGLTGNSYTSNDHRLTADANSSITDPLAEVLTRDIRTKEYDAPVDINSSNFMDYLKTDKVLTESEEKGANAFIEHYKNTHEKYEQVIKDIDSLNAKAYLFTGTDLAGERQKIMDKYGLTYNEYRDIEDVHKLETKISDPEAFFAGFNRISRTLYDTIIKNPATNVAGWLNENTPDFLKIGGPKTEEEKRAAELNKGHKELERAIWENAYENEQANLKAQSPLAYAAGSLSENALWSVAGHGIMSGLGFVNTLTSMAGGSKLAEALIEAGVETAMVDFTTDTLPEAIENYNNGMPLDEVLANAGINIVVNAGINLFMNNAGDALRYINGSNTAKQTADVADDLIPGMNQVDNLAKSVDDTGKVPFTWGQADDAAKALDDQIAALSKQYTDAAQTIEDLSKQIPDIPEESKTLFDMGEESLNVKPDVSSYQNQWDDYLKNLDNNSGSLEITNPNLDNVAKKTYADYVNDLAKATNDSELLDVLNSAVDAVRRSDITEEQFQTLLKMGSGEIPAIADNTLKQATNTITDTAVSTGRRSWLDTFDTKAGATVEDMATHYTDEMKRIVDDFGAKHADLISGNDVVRQNYENLQKAVDDFTDAALHTDKNLDAFYRKIDNSRKKLYNNLRAIDESVAKDAALGNSNVSVLKNADRARYSIFSNKPDDTVASLPGIEDLAGQNREVAARSLFAPEESAEIPKSTIPSMAEATGADSAARTAVDVSPEVPKVETPADVSNPISPAKTSPTTPESPDMRQRGYDKTYQSGRTNIQEGLKTEPEMYEVRHNADTQARADKIFNEAKSLNDAETQARSLISEGDATAVPLTSKLINEYAKTGDTNKAVDLLNALEEKMTKSGQFTQAAKMTIVQNNPDVAMVYLQRQLDKMNAAGKTKFKNKWNNFKLTDDELAAFKNIAPGDVDGISAIYEQIGTRLGKEMPATGIDKLNEYRKLAMLLNPRTHIRNVGANMIMLPVREATDRVSAIGQRAYKLINNDYEVTQSILPPLPADRKLAGTVYDASIKPRLEGFANAKYAENAVGMDAFNKAFSENRQIFRDSKLGTLTNDVLKSDSSILNKISGGKIAQAIDDGKITGSMLENLRRFDYYLLGELEDNPFVKANFSSRLGSYIRAQGIKDISDISDDIVEVAYQEALKATFKDDNVISDMIGGLRNSLNKYSGGVLGDALFPFTKTPSAIAARGIDYSPAGFASSIYHYLKSDRSNLAVSNLFDDLSKATTGTMAIGLGIALAKAGVITGPLSDNKKEKQFQQSQGQQAYSIKIGDRYYSYDWAQPAAIPMILGATIYNAMEADNEDLKQALTNPQTYWNSTKAATNAWIDLSPLKTFADLFGSGDYAGSFAEGVKDAAVSYATSYIPSVMGATARATDNNYRTTYDNSNAFGSALNQAIAKIPGLSKTLPASYDMWGNERTRSDNGVEAAFAQYVNPGQLSHNNTTPIDEEIGRIGAYPNKAEWSVDLGDDGTKKLTNEEYADYQREMGQQSYEYANEFVTNSSFYNDLNDENKKEVLSSLYSLAKAQTERDLFGKEITEGTTNYKLNQIYEAEGAEGVVSYLARDKAIKQAGADPGDTTRKVYDEGITAQGKTVTGTEAIELYVEARDWCKDNGIQNNEKNRQAYYNDHINDPRTTTSTAPTEQTEASEDVTSEQPSSTVPTTSSNPTTSSTSSGGIPSLFNNPELAEAQQTINDYKQMMRDYTGFGKQPESSIPSIADTSNMSEPDKLLYKQEQTAIMEQYGLDYSKENAKLLDKYGETALEAKQILNDSDYSFGENEKKLYKEGGVPAIQDYVSTLSTLEDAGLEPSYSVYESYNHALDNMPSMTPSQYATIVQKIDQNDDSKINQDEMKAFLTANGYTVEQAEELCRVMGNWSSTPYINKKGAWSFH